MSIAEWIINHFVDRDYERQSADSFDGYVPSGEAVSNDCTDIYVSEPYEVEPVNPRWNQRAENEWRSRPIKEWEPGEAIDIHATDGERIEVRNSGRWLFMYKGGKPFDSMPTRVFESLMKLANGEPRNDPHYDRWADDLVEYWNR